MQNNTNPMGKINYHLVDNINTSFITIVNDQLPLIVSIDSLCCNSVKLDPLTIYQTSMFMCRPAFAVNFIDQT